MYSLHSHMMGTFQKKKFSHMIGIYTEQRLMGDAALVSSTVYHLLRTTRGNSIVQLYMDSFASVRPSTCTSRPSFFPALPFPRGKSNDRSKWDDKLTCLPWSLNQEKMCPSYESKANDLARCWLQEYLQLISQPTCIVV